ncbi:MAG: hydroxymethylpyrimidine/phosphomethylpyrimidine kinase [Gammaproteobacteria bacterium]|nr:hydroxymethylpyrimidine/phosphomethylpyrimidine kinase [Gammaproteobacteria bacterium]
MHTDTHNPPVVLSIGGHDPGGGAGIQADIEAIAANGGHAATVVSCLTIQDSCDIHALHQVDSALMTAQSKAVLNDCEVGAIKLGLLGSPQLAQAASRLLEEYPDIPVVLDPVLATGAGTDLASEHLIRVFQKDLLPQCNLITPNSLEARRLSGANLSVDECARDLLDKGVKSVLITGTHEQTSIVSNRLYNDTGLIDESQWERLPGEYHGSGCTLAAAVAASLARGCTIIDAVRLAQAFTWESLHRGFRTGRCQSLPDRLYRLNRQSR